MINYDQYSNIPFFRGWLCHVFQWLILFSYLVINYQCLCFDYYVFNFP